MDVIVCKITTTLFFVSLSLRLFDFLSHSSLLILPYIRIVHLAISPGRDAHGLAEQTREVIAVGNSNLVTNLIDLHVGLLEQFARHFDLRMIERSPANPSFILSISRRGLLVF